MSTSLRLTFRTLAYNNAWANHRLLNACAGLPQAEFEATRTSFFPSLQATLNHNLTVDLFYVDGLEGGTLGHRVFDNPLPCPTMGELFVAQAAVDRRLIAWCEAIGEGSLDRIVHLHRSTGVQSERADRLLLHLFQHQIHHRGQAHAMLSGTNISPPQLDEFFTEADAPLRAQEFAELGWTEEMIWQP